MSDVWGSEAREAVARALAAEASGYPVTGDVPVVAYVEADAVLEALTPHARPIAVVQQAAAGWERADDAFNELRAAVLAKAQEMETGAPQVQVWAAELRSLAGGDQ